MKLHFASSGCQNPKSNRSLPTTIKACAPTQDLQGQSVVVVGLGKSGKAAARLALARGASVVAVDRNENLGLLEQVPLFEMHGRSLRTILGHFDEELLNGADRVIVSPGVPLGNHGLSSLLHSGKQVMSELDFAAEILPKSVKILAVTGTNGKSTVVTFAGQMLRELGIEAFVGGNLGNPLSEAAFQCLAPPSSKPKFQVAVVEVSSYQMEIPNKHFSPSIDTKAKDSSFEVPAVGVVSQLHLGALNAMGTHNYQNAAVAALSIIGLNVGVNIEAISSTIEKLRPPPHRMEIVYKDVHGVTWVDDSKATNAEATYAGLMGLRRQKSVILLGGIAKLVEPLNFHRCVITFGTSGTLIQTTLSSNGLSIPCVRAANLKDAVSCARKMAKPGDAVVLSPGCASFDEFRNFEHRGMVFQELARSL